MFECDHTKLKLRFQEFHKVEESDLPEYGDFCLLELKDGRHTAGIWYPNNTKEGEPVSGKFSRGSFDNVELSEVSGWHVLRGYDMSGCLEKAGTKQINLGKAGEEDHFFEITEFKTFQDGDFPKKKQYCLLILTEGRMAAGRWEPGKEENTGSFIYASALASYSMEKVWAWTELSSDEIFAAEEEKEKERILEEERNKHAVADPAMFPYGTDIEVYYEKAREKLQKEYPWASIAQMKKITPYVIVPRHGKYVFGQDWGTFMGEKDIREWTKGSTADEFVDFLCEYTKEKVKNSDPEIKFAYGYDIDVYLEKAYEKVKKDYRWLEKSMLEECWQYAIRQVNGEWEFVRKSGEEDEYRVWDVSSADGFLKDVEREYQDAALKANPVVEEHPVPFGSVDINGWGLEKYIVYRLQSGDYKVYVQAGDRTTGGSRTFFITPDCFEAENYEAFLDRYLEIVPGGSFGLGKADLMANPELKKFFGY